MKVPPFGFKVLRGPIRVEDIVRWGVWLGRHICGREGGWGACWVAISGRLGPC